MTTAEFKEEALKRIERVPPERYEAVLAQLDVIIDRPKGTPGKDLLKFAGSISRETGEAMQKVIDEECRRIDYASWGLSPPLEHEADHRSGST